MSRRETHTGQPAYSLTVTGDGELRIELGSEFHAGLTASLAAAATAARHALDIDRRVTAAS